MWWLYALINALAGSWANVFTKLASREINPILGALVAQITAVFFIFLFFLFSGRHFDGTRQGFLFAFLMGLMTAFGYTAWFKLFSTGASLIVAGILAILGVIVFSALWGIIFLGEKLTLTVFIGFLLAILSAYLLMIK